jgi:hypothetical protein
MRGDDEPNIPRHVYAKLAEVLHCDRQVAVGIKARVDDYPLGLAKMCNDTLAKARPKQGDLNLLGAKRDSLVNASQLCF